MQSRQETLSAPNDILLDVEDLHIWFPTSQGIVKAVDGMDFRVRRGEVFALIGESGSGKSVTALSILRILNPPGRRIAGRILFESRNLFDMDDAQLQGYRRTNAALIFQQVKSSLNPVLSVGNQLVEMMLMHGAASRKDARLQAVALLKRMGLPDPEALSLAYPHELSGGQAQRIGIGLAIAGSPDLLIADEPTGALDVTIQAQVLDLLQGIRDEQGTAILLITHDLSTMATMADRVAVIYAGQVVEQARTEGLLQSALHPYTKGLISAVSSLQDNGGRLRSIPGMAPNPMRLPAGCRFSSRCQARIEYGLTICELEEPECLPAGDDHLVRCWLYSDVQKSGPAASGAGWENAENNRSVASREAGGSARMVGSESLVTVRGLRKYYPFRAGFFGQIRGVKHAVDGVDLDIREGETLGLVGESGSGKTTIGYSILSLVRPTSGSVHFDGKDVAGLRPAQLKAARKDMQIVFENPLASLNPRMTIIEIVSEGPIIHRLGTPVECRERAVEALRMVGIDSELLDRLPGELSGGQQQRVCIARALALRPRFIMADEPVSSLDASIRADVLNLLTDLQTDLELTMLFIAHDLRVIKHIADRVAVLYLGRIVELARRDDLFSNPLHPYTVALISAAPALEPDAKRERVLLPGEVPSVIDPPPGCRFHPRCPIAVDRCAIDEPALLERGTGHWVSCWLAAGA